MSGTRLSPDGHAIHFSLDILFNRRGEVWDPKHRVRFGCKATLIGAELGGTVRQLNVLIVIVAAILAGCNDLGTSVSSVSTAISEMPTVTSGPFVFTLIVPSAFIPVNDTLRAIVQVSNQAATAETLGVGASLFSWSLKTADGRTVMWGPKVVPLSIRILVLNPYQAEDIYSIRQAIADESAVPVMPGSYVVEAQVRNVGTMAVDLTLQ